MKIVDGVTGLGFKADEMHLRLREREREPDLERDLDLERDMLRLSRLHLRNRHTAIRNPVHAGISQWKTPNDTVTIIKSLNNPY